MSVDTIKTKVCGYIDAEGREGSNYGDDPVELIVERVAFVGDDTNKEPRLVIRTRHSPASNILVDVDLQELVVLLDELEDWS